MSTIWKSMTKKEEWQALFPMNPTRSYLESGVFVKKLTSIAVSTLALRRGMYPERCFQQHRFFDMKVVTLLPGSGDPAAEFLRRSMDQAFEAIDRKYLRRMEIALHEDEDRPETLLETFTFSYHHKPERRGVAIYGETCEEQMSGQLAAVQTATRRLLMTVNSCERNEPALPTNCLACTRVGLSVRSEEQMRGQLAAVQTATRRLLMTVNSCERNEPALPTNYAIVFRLYYNDDAPEDYNPPGFEEDKDFARPVVPAQADWVLLGDVRTPTHKLSVKKYSAAGRARSPPPPPRRLPRPPTPAASLHSGSLSPGIANMSLASLPEVRVRCPCVEGEHPGNDEESLIISQVIACGSCKNYQHKACFGLRADAEETSPEFVHYCEVCASADRSLRCSDPDLVGKDPSQAARTCAFRRTMEYCTRTRTITARILKDTFLVSERTVSSLLLRLEAEGVVKTLERDSRNVDTIRAVNTTNALKRMPKLLVGPDVGASGHASLSDHIYQQYRQSSQEQDPDDAMEGLLPTCGPSPSADLARLVSAAPPLIPRDALLILGYGDGGEGERGDGGRDAQAQATEGAGRGRGGRGRGRGRSASKRKAVVNEGSEPKIAKRK